MRKTKVVLADSPIERADSRSKPSETPEGRENQCIALAYNLVEKRLREGTATSQETVHFLRMGSLNARLEMENLKLKKEKMEAEIEAIHSQKRVEELYSNALAAMKSYEMHNEEG